jgi:DNA ligase-1
MNEFAKLFDDLDSTTSTNEKIAALTRYFKTAPPHDSLWTVLLLTGRTARKTLTANVLKRLFLKATQYPEWLYDECYSQVGDTAETLSLLAQTLRLCRPAEAVPEHRSLTEWLETEIPLLAKIEDEDLKAESILRHWKMLSPLEVFIFNKLITGGFRVGVSEKIVIRGLSDVYDVPTDQIAHRMSGLGTTESKNFEDLISKDAVEVATNQPYPFCLAHAWQERKESDWDSAAWSIEWKYDGIRSQIIRREENVWIWSRGEDLITTSFPELESHFHALPIGTVLDGEILVIKDGHVQPFQELQKRLGRKKVSTGILKDTPAGFIAYDCLERGGKDLRQRPFTERRKHLEEVMQPLLNSQVRLSKILSVQNLEELENLRAQSRENEAEGLMIKLNAGTYAVGRKTGNWWKHKVDPLTLDAVLIYAQAGSGRRANLYTDYTFALVNEAGELVPFAKAYSGLDQAEIEELDGWIRRNTKDKFGPVRSVLPQHVFEIGFEGISKSGRHKSGIAVRFPRILRWRRDKKPADADSLSTAFELLKAEGLQV